MKDIMLRIIGRQINRNEEVEGDLVEFMTMGKAYKKGKTTYIVYEETEMSGMPGVKTTLRIDDSGSVRMKRFGNNVSANNMMEFREGQRFNSRYNTPMGPVPMEILTNSIINELKEEDCTGNLFIDYDISLKGLTETRSLLNIEISETKNIVKVAGISDTTDHDLTEENAQVTTFS